MTDQEFDVAIILKENESINMGIWKQVDKSDPAQLKKVSVGRGFLSIDAYPQIKKATEVFGPMGLGFGLIDVKYDIISGVDVSTKNNPKAVGNVMVMQSVFWYKYPGGGQESNGSFPIMNSMVFTGHSDTPKKLITNSISKALSYLGFNYDVFCGSWDDDPYSDRPDIPCPAWMKSNLITLLDTDFFTEEQRSKVKRFQMDAGWTLQSVENSIKGCIKRMESKGYAIPKLLQEGESTDGISEENHGSEAKEAEEKGSQAKESG